MTKLPALLALASMAVALTTNSALAEEGGWDNSGRRQQKVALESSFTLAFTQTLNASNAKHCGAAILPYAVAANGAGYSSLGALSFELQKTLAFPGIMQGCATLKSPDGDALYANYAGTINGSAGVGTLTFTGGTGRFVGATGSAKFTGMFVGLYPTLTIFGGGAIPNLQGTAFYLVEGTVYLRKEKD